MVEIVFLFLSYVTYLFIFYKIQLSGCLTVLSSEDSVPRKFVILCYETMDKGQDPGNLKYNSKSRNPFGALC